MSAAESSTGLPAVGPPSAFAPLRQRLFALIWIATVLGNVGSFMRDVASAWLVTDLSTSPLAVSAIQAAGTLPAFLLAIPAGVLSDILDRRHLLIGILCCLAAVSALLSLLAATGNTSVESLIILTFLGGTGAALAAPSWQAIVPELVSKADLRSAVALNSLGFNVARATGPALGGLLVATLGAAVTYTFDMVSDLVVIAVLLLWKRNAMGDDALRERFGSAMRAGLRYARASAAMRSLLVRAVLFFVGASSVWSLLPIVARRDLGGGPGLYGLLLGSVGVGAIVGALTMPRMRRALGQDGLLIGAMLATGLVTGLMATIDTVELAIGATFILGMAWIAVLTTMNGTVQSILPDWVRGRGLAIYMTAQGAGMTAGSLGWGFLASEVGTDTALLCAAAFLVVLGLATLVRRVALPTGDDDLSPANHWADPDLHEMPENDRGPVLVTIAYDVAAHDRPAFLATINRLSEERRRDGAYAWGIMEDAARPERLVEWFFVESWAEHLRQHRRVSKADADIQSDLRAFHHGDKPPIVTHLLGLDHRSGHPAR